MIIAKKFIEEVNGLIIVTHAVNGSVLVNSPRIIVGPIINWFFYVIPI